MSQTLSPSHLSGLRAICRQAWTLGEGAPEAKWLWHRLLTSRAVVESGAGDADWTPAAWSEAGLARLTTTVAPNHERLRHLVAEISADVLRCPTVLDDALQIWLDADRQRRQPRPGAIDPAELPLLTQLFTEPYMVAVLLDDALSSGSGRERVFDPCCGAGAFLGPAVERLVAQRVARGEAPAQAARLVLAGQVRGLDIDPLCAGLALVRVALAAARGAGVPLAELPLPRVRCCAIENAPPDSLAALLGSLNDPEQGDPAVAPDVAALLTARYDCVVTNVPYLARGKQPAVLRDFCAARFPEAKADLANVFLERCREWTLPGGRLALVTPQNWLFLKSARRFRKRWLREMTWQRLVRLGEHGFQGRAAGAFSVLLVCRNARPAAEHLVETLDLAESAGSAGKAEQLNTASFQRHRQADWIWEPESRVTWQPAPGAGRLGDYALVCAGVQTADAPRYVRYFWELPRVVSPWELWQRAPAASTGDAGRSQIVLWNDGRGFDTPGAVIRGRQAWDRGGMLVGLLRQLPVVEYDGGPFDQSCAAVLPLFADSDAAVRAFLQSPEFSRAVRRLDGKLNVAPATLADVPFDPDDWPQAEGSDVEASIDDTDPTQYPFSADLATAQHPEQVAVAAWLGYRWPRETGDATGPAAEAGYSVLSAGGTEGDRPHAADELRAFVCDRWGRETAARRLPDWYAARAGDDPLDLWLRNRFFTAHCRLFRERPFVWHLWDGVPHGFQVLVNDHRFDAALLARLIDVEIPRWRDSLTGAPDREQRDAAAEKLQQRLREIQAGRPPLFIRWKPPAAQPLGWSPDLADGVRLNIRPFVLAGVLRSPPRLHWRPDRGQDPPTAPWYHAFQGRRCNEPPESHQC